MSRTLYYGGEEIRVFQRNQIFIKLQNLSGMQEPKQLTMSEEKTQISQPVDNQNIEQQQPNSSEQLGTEITSNSNGLQKPNIEATQSESKVENSEKKQEEKIQESADSNKDKIVLTAKQLSVMNKQLKKLDKLKKQNENLKKQGEQLKRYIVGLEKKQDEMKKNFLKVQGLEETIKQLQKMLNESTTNEQEAIRESNKNRQMAKYEKDMNESLKIEIQELRAASSEHFLLKQEIARLSNQCRNYKQAIEKYPKMTEQIEQLQTQLENIQKQLTQKKSEITQQKSLCSKLQKKVEQLLEEKRSWEKQKNKILCEKQEVLGKIEALQEQLEDERAQRNVLDKKQVHEIKQLKVALHQEHQKLKLTEIQLTEARKKQKKQIDFDKVKYSSLSKEDLFNLLEEAEMKIISFKMALNDASEKLSLAEEKVKQRDASIFSLTRELTKSLPNLHESQGMDYIEKDIIEIGLKQKQDWAEIVQKVMIENLRLKSSVTALGEQYNNKMREINKNENS